MLGRNSLPWEWWGTGTVCPEKLWMPNSWMSSGWGLEQPCLLKGVLIHGKGVVKGSSSNPRDSFFLWFYPSLWATFWSPQQGSSFAAHPVQSLWALRKSLFLFCESSWKHAYLSSCLVSLATPDSLWGCAENTPSFPGCRHAVCFQNMLPTSPRISSQKKATRGSISAAVLPCWQYTELSTRRCKSESTCIFPCLWPSSQEQQANPPCLPSDYKNAFWTGFYGNKS